jgi:hypothetical protein
MSSEVYIAIYNEYYCKIYIVLHANYEPVTVGLHGTCVYFYSTDFLFMFAEDERAYPQAVNNRHTYTEGVIQNPATGRWRESR